MVVSWYHTDSGRWASTTLNEAGFPPDVIEATLAHIDANPTRAAYNRATYMTQRVELMDWWGQKISDPSVAATLLT